MAKRNAQLIAYEVSKIFGDGKQNDGDNYTDSSGFNAYVAEDRFGEATAEVW